MFHITFVQIGIFDWLLWRQKGSIFVKMFKNLLLRNHLQQCFLFFIVVVIPGQ